MFEDHLKSYEYNRSKAVCEMLNDSQGPPVDG